LINRKRFFRWGYLTWEKLKAKWWNKSDGLPTIVIDRHGNRPHNSMWINTRVTCHKTCPLICLMSLTSLFWLTINKTVSCCKRDSRRLWFSAVCLLVCWCQLRVNFNWHYGWFSYLRKCLRLKEDCWCFCLTINTTIHVGIIKFSKQLLFIFVEIVMQFYIPVLTINQNIKADKI